MVRYLAGVVGVEEALGQVYEIGGADRLTYVEMLQQAAEVITAADRVPIADRAGAHPAPVVVLDRRS